VDLFANTLPQVWHLRSGDGQQRKDIISMFNWDDKKSDSVEIELDKLDLPDGGNGTYVGFDYWANKFVPPFSGALKAELRPSCCKVIAIRPLLERPVLVSTSRHITQGIVDVMEEDWNNRANTLSGKSKVVGEDPYEIRIFAPTSAWQALQVKVSEADRRAGVTAGIQQEDQAIRVTINSSENREVSWDVAFKKGQL